MEWLIAKQLVYGHAAGAISLSEQEEINARYIEMMASSDRDQVHCIFDIREVKKVDFRLAVLNRVYNFYLEPNHGWIIHINRNPIYTTAGYMLAGMMSFRFHVVASMEEAVAFLKEHDPDLDWDLARQSYLTGDDAQAICR